MNKIVDSYIDSNANKMISELQELLHIPSVEGTPAPDAPFGTEVKKALDYTLELAKSMGFTVENKDGYVGIVDYGQGDEMLAILCHLDVVPEDTGWKYPPYSATIEDGRIYARGALDDKGPAMSSLYAMAAVKEAAVATKRRIRLILGTNEETGWGCMDYYKSHCELPTIAFSPDGDYPLVNSEKGIVRATFENMFSSKIKFTAGTAANKVPHEVKIEAPLNNTDIKALEAKMSELKALGYGVEYAVDGTFTCTIKGISAHAAMNNLGKNALVAGLDVLTALDLQGQDKVVADYLHEKLMYDLHGEHLGLDFTDESGRQTINPAIIRWDDNGISQLTFDMRCPTSKKLSHIFAQLESILSEIGFRTSGEQELKDGLFVPRDSELVQKLLEVYNTRMNTNAEPLAIGGGTYARAFENAVAFGCEKPGVASTVHMANEYITVDDMILNAKLIADAILALACK